MKCELCAKEGKTSKLYIEKGEILDRTHPETYYDENAVIHIHRKTPGKRARIHCSNGHKGWIMGATKCISCNFGEEEKVVWGKPKGGEKKPDECKHLEWLHDTLNDYETCMGCGRKRPREGNDAG